MRGATVLLILACVGCAKKGPPAPEPNVALEGESRAASVALMEAITGSAAIQLKYGALWAGDQKPPDRSAAVRHATAVRRVAHDHPPYQAAAVVGAPAAGGAHAALGPAALEHAYPPAAAYLKDNWARLAVTNPLRDFPVFNGTQTGATGANRRVVFRVTQADAGEPFEAFAGRVQQALRDGGTTITGVTRAGPRTSAAGVEVKYTHGRASGVLHLLIVERYDESDAELVAALADSGSIDGIVKAAMKEPGPYLLVLVRERRE